MVIDNMFATVGWYSIYDKKGDLVIWDNHMTWVMVDNVQKDGTMKQG